MSERLLISPSRTELKKRQTEKKVLNFSFKSVLEVGVNVGAVEDIAKKG
jgi:hypothetical protein